MKKPTRPWHESENETGPIDQVYKSDSEIGPIDQIHKPDKIVSINQVRNEVDKPKLKDQVYTPGFMTLDKLRGNPLRVIRFLFGAIEDFKEKTTRQIQLCEIIQALEITRDSARTGLRFLAKTAIISTVEYLAGLNGWTRYKLSDTIFEELWSIDQVHKSGLKPGLLSNSSNKNTTIGEGWDEIDISPLESRGLHKDSLLQLKNKNTPDVVQRSIYHFAFTLEANPKYKDHKEPLNVLITVLKRGEAWIEPNYVSPQKRAMQAFLEAEKEGQRKAEKVEKEIFELKFNVWFQKLDISDRKKKTISDHQADFRRGEWLEIKKAWS